MAGPKGSKYYDIFLNYDLWLENRSSKEKIINPELFDLLLMIEKHRSLVAASEEKGISYRKAWGLIKDAEKQLNLCLVRRHRGGEKGGKSELSPDGRNLIDAYLELRREIDESIYKITKIFFHTINN